MTYKKCPKCELNYITDTNELCTNCRLKTATIVSKAKLIETDFSKIIFGRLYGTNSRTIYEKFCDTLGWDKSKSNQFGWQTPLYAANVDKEKSVDVWFIFYPNFDAEKLNKVVDNYRFVNLIQNDGKNIIEIVDDCFGASNSANRITFVRTNKGYEFFGVYKIIQNGTSRLYQKISDVYPY